jgi:hypothetical protein
LLGDSAAIDKTVVATSQEAAAVVLLRDVASEELTGADVDRMIFEDVVEITERLPELV